MEQPTLRDVRTSDRFLNHDLSSPERHPDNLEPVHMLWRAASRLYCLRCLYGAEPCIPHRLPEWIDLEVDVKAGRTVINVRDTRGKLVGHASAPSREAKDFERWYDNMLNFGGPFFWGAVALVSALWIVAGARACIG